MRYLLYQISWCRITSINSMIGLAAAAPRSYHPAFGNFLLQRYGDSMANLGMFPWCPHSEDALFRTERFELFELAIWWLEELAVHFLGILFWEDHCRLALKGGPDPNCLGGMFWLRKACLLWGHQQRVHSQRSDSVLCGGSQCVWRCYTLPKML